MPLKFQMELCSQFFCLCKYTTFIQKYIPLDVELNFIVKLSAMKKKQKQNRLYLLPSNIEIQLNVELCVRSFLFSMHIITVVTCTTLNYSNKRNIQPDFQLQPFYFQFAK